MIPPKIHYCWFGRKPLPPKAKACIESWRNFLPGYEIVEWNEDNFDVNSIPYTRDAYAAGKYAFVSDYARFKILYEHGGLYFDTDVEIIASMDDVIADGPFMGFELNPDANSEQYPCGAVAAGLGLGAEKGMPLYKDIIDYYKEASFSTGLKSVTVVYHVSQLLRRQGLACVPGKQHVAGVTIYPADWFNPFDDGTGRVNRTANTRTIHWYSKTWMDARIRRRIPLTRFVHRIIGDKFTGAVKQRLQKLLGIKL